MKEQYDRHARPAIEYQPGQKVYLESTNIRTPRPSKKLDDKRYGPFEVIEKIGQAAYKLKLPDSWRAIRPVFNESYLSPYKAPRYRRQQKPPPPPPVEVEGVTQYVVETILKSKRTRGGHVQYLVKWEGYPHEENTWEPDIKLRADVPDLIKEFHQDHPDQPSPTNIRTLDFSQCEKPRLYNPAFNILGEGFQKQDPLSRIDAILPCSPQYIDNVLNQRIPLDVLAVGFPSYTTRIWIYETMPVKAFTMVLVRYLCGLPKKLYQLHRLIGLHELQGKYDFEPPLNPSYASHWLNHDCSPYHHKIYDS